MRLIFVFNFCSRHFFLPQKREKGEKTQTSKCKCLKQDDIFINNIVEIDMKYVLSLCEVGKTAGEKWLDIVFRDGLNEIEIGKWRKKEYTAQPLDCEKKAAK